MLTLIKSNVRYILYRGKRVKFSLYKCDCGVEKEIRNTNANRGVTSCGCLKKKMLADKNTTHGLSRNNKRLYTLWKGMKGRCTQPNSEFYHCYGGRGIKVCEAWQNDFAAFHKWAMDNGYHEGLSIERKDVNGNYEPDNCSWIPLTHQGWNTRYALGVDKAKRIRSMASEGMGTAEIARSMNVCLSTVKRIKNGRTYKF